MRLLPALLACLFLTFLPASVLAQEPAPTEEAAPPADADLQSLISILENEEARNRLIETLRSASEGAETEVGPTAEQTVARQFAEYTGDLAEGAVAVVSGASTLIGQIIDILSGVAYFEFGALMRVILNVALVVAGTFGVFLVMRMAAAFVHNSTARTAERGGIVRRIVSIVVSAITDAATVLLAWGAGYIIALNVGQTGRMGINQTLFLNAFVLIELAKVAVRVLLAPRWPSLRPYPPLSDMTSAYWYFWISRLVSLVGYTFLFVAPILAANVSREAAEAVRVLVMLAALAMGCMIVLQNRDMVRDRLRRHAASAGGASRPLAMLAGVWHLIAIVYLVVMFLLWLSGGDEALPFALWATFETVVAILVGVVLARLVTRLATRGLRLPGDVKQRLPLLETRLNAFVPKVLRVVRIVIALAVVVAIAQIWQIADFIGWLSTEFGQRVATSVVSAGLILLVGGLVYLAVQSWVEYRLNPNFGTVPTPRERTLLSLFRNAFTIVLAVLVFMLALSELGVNIGPLLAGAGVVGLAVGFGAQKLVQDIITGAFIQFENAMNEGDVVTAAGITGTVEKLTIRSVSIRTLDGAYHLIPFSSVDAVTNFQKYFSYHLAEIGVAYRESIPDVKDALQEAFERLKETEFGEFIIGDLEIHGVSQFGESDIKVRVRIKTMAGQQWGLGRAYNEKIKDVFDERGIEIPYRHLTLYMGRDKKGEIEPFRIESQPEDAPTDDRKSVAVSARPRKRQANIQQDGPPGDGNPATDEGGSDPH